MSSAHWQTGKWQDLVSFVAGLDKKAEKRANQASLRYITAVTRAPAETTNKQIRGLLDNQGKYAEHEKFVKKLAEELYAYYPQTNKAQETLQWVCEILLRHMETYYAEGRLSLEKLISARIKLIRSYTETGQTLKAGQLLQRSLELLAKDATEDPAIFETVSVLHRFAAEYYRNNMRNKADMQQWQYHCSEAERLAAADPYGRLFGLINAKMLYCNALEAAQKPQEARQKAMECIPLCEKYCQQKPGSSSKKTLAEAYGFVGQDSLQMAWNGKMDLSVIMEAVEAYHKSIALYEEVIAAQRSYHTYLAAAGTYSGAAEAHVFAWSVCPEEETETHLAQAKTYLDQAGKLISVTDEAINTLRAKKDKLSWLYKLYAWYEVQKDKASANEVYRQIGELRKEIDARTGEKRYNSFIADFGLRVPKRKKSGGWFRRR